MENKKKKSVNGYNEGYDYPIDYYKMNDYRKSKPISKVEGSFWTPCDEKAKDRHSFCDNK